jgi:DNA gyrase/topoisomerase IV subunit B
LILGKTTTYDESDVSVLSGMTSIRARPEMYIGDTGPQDAWTLVREAADNSVDEALAGRNKACYIHLSKEGHWVADSGQGIPTGNILVEDLMHKKHKISAFQAVLSMLHAGAKFKGTAYKISRGTHGLGVTATNALSSVFKAWTFYKGHWYFIEYASSKLITEVTKVKTGPTLPSGKIPQRGTIIFCQPDLKIFKEGTRFSTKLALDWARVTAYLVPGFRVIVEARGKRKEFYFENGPHDYVRDRIAALKCHTLGSTFHISTPLVDAALAFTDADGLQTAFFTNGLHNPDGGAHAVSTYNALFEALQPWAKRGRNDFVGQDLKEGLLGLVNVKLSSPRFSSQLKQKLTDPRAKKPLEDVLVEALRKFFKANKKLAEDLCVRATELHSMTAKFKVSKQTARALSNVQKLGFPSKFAAAPRCKPEDRESYLVEGDCLGGETPILLADVSTITIREMVEGYSKGKSYWGWCMDPKTKQEFIFEFDSPRLAKYTQDLVEVELSDGTKYLCTPEHPWLLESGEYNAAENLKKGQQLQSRTRITLDITVKSVRRIHLDTPVATYDATSPHYHNYALGNGVYVHNSAGGTAKLARDNKFQEVLPLKGKILNVEKSSSDAEVLESDEVKYILAVLGFDPKAKDPYKKLRTGKVICLADADVDGYHINCLILTLLYKYLPGLFDRGMVFIVNAPEYYATNPKTKENFMGFSVIEVQGKVPKGVAVHHLKGWGEISADMLEPMAFDPKTRQLIKIGVVDKQGHKEFKLLMGDDTAYRKRLLGV